MVIHVCVFPIITRGLPSQAFEYIHYNGGLESDKDYPYRGENGKCHFNQSDVVATVAAVMNISQVMATLFHFHNV